MDYYELLGIQPGASEKDIKRAYRQKALSCHPDKVGPDNVEAAELFHTLSLAIETLTNPEKRLKYDQVYKAKIAEKERLERMDSQRRQARDSLLQREQQAAMKHKQASVALNLNKIKEEEEQRKRAMEEHLSRTSRIVQEQLIKTEKSSSSQDNSPTLLDLTLKLKWKHENVTEDDLKRIFSIFGPLDSVLISSKGKKTAMIIFKTLAGAKAAMSSQTKSLSLFQIQWASGKEPTVQEPIPPISQPKILESEKIALNTSTTKLDDYEAMTLLKMKQAAERLKEKNS